MHGEIIVDSRQSSVISPRRQSQSTVSVRQSAVAVRQSTVAVRQSTVAVVVAVGTDCAWPDAMLARSLDELLVYRKSLNAAAAISAILERRGVRRDGPLRKQMGSASAAVAANIAEGFGQ